MYDIPLGQVKLRVDKTTVMKAAIEKEGNKLLISFGFNVMLKDRIKTMDGARWLGFDEMRPRKIWAINDNQRNRFQLAYLMDLNPYAPYDAPLIEYVSKRTNPAPYSHQIETIRFILTRRQCIVAEDMGLGKSLAAIESMEYAQKILAARDFMWVGPRSALDSARYEFLKWRAKVVPYFYTYESLRGMVEKGMEVPQILIFDEASRLKTPTAQRTQAAQAIADAMREKYGRDALIVLMTGTPAPKSPDDWYSLCSIACPGFIVEGNYQKFKNRLALIKQYESIGGATFPKLVTWWDNEAKCKICGKLQDDPDHDTINMIESWYHRFQPSVNEVNKLYQRMKGLVIVKFKDSCLDLPDKIYKTIKCQPSASIMRAANLICRTAASAAKALMLTRELSDGFQYQETEDGIEACPACHGNRTIKMIIDLDDPDNFLDSESLTRGHRAIWDDETNQIIGYKEESLRRGEKEIKCVQCNGSGQVPRYIRTSARVDCPKTQVLIDLLDQYNEEGRFVLWAGFTDSVDRCVETCISQKWEVIRCDGRGWWCTPNIATKGIKTGVDMLQAFDNKNDFPNIAFVGHPGAGGMGLNLTASSVNCFYSNTFKLEDYLQAVDRIHRPGADHNRGCMIINLVHLPQDELVLQSHAKKHDLMLMSMGALQKELIRIEENFDRA